ncbi:choline-phosphate cytidylyltransferase [Tilletia horrida]|nr:choline-phosphate cytidylyltransferase [Tilletia horrida]
MALPRHAHLHPHPPPGRSKKRHLSRSNDRDHHPTDPAILALQAQNQPHNISSSRDASEEDNDDEDDSLDEEEEDDDEAEAQDDDQPDKDPNSAVQKPRKLSKAERAARRAAARRHPSSDDADAVGVSGPGAAIAGGASSNSSGPAGLAAGAPATGDASTVSPSRRASTHAALRDRDHHTQVTATLAHASAALHQHSLNSSSASNGDEEDGSRTSSSASNLGLAGDAPASSLLARRAPGPAAAAAAAPGSESAAGLHLGSLPEVKSADIADSTAPPTVTVQSAGPLAAASSASHTPKIGPGSATATAGATSGPLSGFAPPQKKLTAKSGLGRSGEEEDDFTDDAGGTPYDGDVEGPNPSKLSTTASPPSIGNIPPSATHSIPFPIGSPITATSFHAPPAQYQHPNTIGSAPEDTPLTLPRGGPRPRTRVRSDASDKEHAILNAPKAPQEIRAYIRDCISGERAKGRSYQIKEPRDGGGTRERPIRIYADGVFDMFHYAHTLLLRQAKLFFPHVHLIAGVNSSTLCAEHKNRPLLSSEERYASVAACKWVDEVIVDAPWFITPEFIKVHNIDYVAHDDAPYANASSGSSDVYGWLKEQGLFLPTLRTEGVSTSELLGRVVEVYQSHALDDKLRKVGLEKLIDSRSPSGQTSPHHPEAEQK